MTDMICEKVCHAHCGDCMLTTDVLRPLASCWQQVAEAKEAGAAGIIGVIANVLGNGSPIMSSFAAAIGLDAPVEVCKLYSMW